MSNGLAGCDARLFFFVCCTLFAFWAHTTRTTWFDDIYNFFVPCYYYFVIQLFSLWLWWLFLELLFIHNALTQADSIITLKGCVPLTDRSGFFFFLKTIQCQLILTNNHDFCVHTILIIDTKQTPIKLYRVFGLLSQVLLRRTCCAIFGGTTNTACAC